MATQNYAVNYNDERFGKVEADKQAKMGETKNMYNEMLGQSDSYYQTQIDESKNWANKQQEIQQQNTDFAIEKIDQQKEQAQKDYIKEQKGAYTDYQKEINDYGARAEQMASSGLSNSGYSESSRVALYNTYQNRYATAKDSVQRAMLNYDNSIKEATLANNAALAEISYNALQQQLQLSLQGFQYKNTLLTQQAEAINNVENTYYTRYQNVLNQINTENSLAEQVRQYNEKMAEEKRQYDSTLAQQKAQAAQTQKNWEKEYALSLKQYNLSASKSSGSSSGGGSSRVSTAKKVSSTPAVSKTNNVSKTTTASKATNVKNSNALKTFVNAAPSSGTKLYTSYIAALKAKKIPLVYSESGALKNGYIRKKTVNGKVYYF